MNKKIKRVAASLLIAFMVIIPITLLISHTEEKEILAFSTRVPAISLRNYYNPEKRDAFVNSLGEAFHEHGFVVVTDVTVDQKKLKTAYDSIKDFFEKDLEIKQKIQSSTNNGERGYVTKETPKGQPLEVVDFKEILHFGREVSKKQKNTLNYPENLWPEDSDLKETVMPLYYELEKFLLPIAEAASEYLGESKELFPEMMAKGDHLFRFLHYLRSPGQKINWSATHTDLNFLTLIPMASSGGLQVQLQDGSWEDIEIPPNAIVINVGDSLENLTNGFYRSGIHRVVSKPGGDPERWSVVFHGHTRHDLDMSPLTSAIERTGGEQKYPNATGWELLYPQVTALGRSSRPILEKVAESGVIEQKIKYGIASEKVMRILANENLASKEILAELARIDAEKGEK